MITLNDVKAAKEKVSSYVRRTPLWKSETLSKRLGTNVYLKMELFQKTGSFKPRGAFNQILASGKDALAKGAVAFSGGNFAQGVAYASLVLGVDTIICMPENTPQNYVDATRGYSATIDFSPDMHTAFSRYNDLAEQGRRLYIHLIITIRCQVPELLHWRSLKTFQKLLTWLSVLAAVD